MTISQYTLGQYAAGAPNWDPALPHLLIGEPHQGSKGQCAYRASRDLILKAWWRSCSCMEVAASIPFLQLKMVMVTCAQGETGHQAVACVFRCKDRIGQGKPGRAPANACECTRQS